MPTDREATARGRLCSGIGTPSPKWVADPAEGLVVKAVTAYLTHKLGARLRAGGITPKDLAAATGDGESTWRNRLNGTRGVGLEDLVAAALSVDPELFSVFPNDARDPDQVLPREYRPLVVMPAPGHVGLPVFRRDTPAWPLVAERLDGWWSKHAGRGRSARAMSDALPLELLDALEPWLPSSTGVFESTPLLRRIAWPVRGRSLSVVSLGYGQDVADVQTGLRTTARILWPEDSRVEAGDHMLVFTGSPPTLGNIADALGLTGRDQVLSLREAHRLGSSEGEARADLQLAWSKRATAQIPLLWLLVKR